MMTKKHFVKLADILKRNRDSVVAGSSVQGALNVVALELADMCALENPNFSRRRFLTACGFSVAEVGYANYGMES